MDFEEDESEPKESAAQIASRAAVAHLASCRLYRIDILSSHIELTQVGGGYWSSSFVSSSWHYRWWYRWQEPRWTPGIATFCMPAPWCSTGLGSRLASLTRSQLSVLPLWAGPGGGGHFFLKIHDISHNTGKQFFTWDISPSLLTFCIRRSQCWCTVTHGWTWFERANRTSRPSSLHSSPLGTSGKPAIVGLILFRMVEKVESDQPEGLGVFQNIKLISLPFTSLLTFQFFHPRFRPFMRTNSFDMSTPLVGEALLVFGKCLSLTV